MAFIRKNTPELRNKLEELGYVNSNLYNGNCIALSVIKDDITYTCVPESLINSHNPRISWSLYRKEYSNEQDFIKAAYDKLVY